MNSRPHGSAVVGLAGGLLRPGYHHSAAHHRGRLGFLGWRMGTLGLAQAFAAQEEHFGIFYQAIGNGGGDGGIEEDIAPVGKWGVYAEPIFMRTP
jgi:hypothetical protein